MTEDFGNFYDSEAKEKNAKLSADGKRQHNRKVGDLRSILKKPEGRRFVWELLGDTGVFRSVFALNSNQTSFNEGRRDVGLELLQKLNEADASAFAQMQREYVSEVNSKREEING